MSDSNRILVSDQCANLDTLGSWASDEQMPLVTQSPLHHVELDRLVAVTRQAAGVVFVEQPVLGLLTLRARDINDTIQQAVNEVLGVGLPSTLQAHCSSSASSHSNGASTEAAEYNCIRWMAPDEWLISCSLQNVYALELALRERLQSESVALVNVSGGYGVMTLSGHNVLEVLQKSTAYDTHPDNLMPGKVVNTMFSKAQATLRCVDAGVYELIVRRSFVDYVWLWLQTAAEEYGLRVEQRAQ